MKFTNSEKFNIFFMAALAVTIVVLLFAACSKQQQLEQIEQHATRGYTQDVTPMTVGIEAQSLVGDGIALYRVIQSAAANVYAGDYVLQSVVSGHVVNGSALLYSGGGYRVVPNAIAEMYKLNYATQFQSNHVRGYKLPVWEWPEDETCVTFTPGTDDGDIVIDDERKITRPLPCPRACD